MLADPYSLQIFRVSEGGDVHLFPLETPLQATADNVKREQV